MQVILLCLSPSLGEESGIEMTTPFLHILHFFFFLLEGLIESKFISFEVQNLNFKDLNEKHRVDCM